MEAGTDELPYIDEKDMYELAAHQWKGKRLVIQMNRQGAHDGKVRVWEIRKQAFADARARRHRGARIADVTKAKSPDEKEDGD